MKPALLPLLACVALTAGPAHAQTRPDTTLLAPPVAPGLRAGDSIVAAVRAADDERIAATVAADRARLEAVYSDELHYGHSNGRVDSKESQIQALVSGANHFESAEYKERTFTPIAPGVVLMTGRLVFQMRHRVTQQKNTLDLKFLAVWREENGRWRFRAWQSCRTPAN